MAQTRSKAYVDGLKVRRRWLGKDYVDKAFRDAQEKAKQYAGLADVALGRAQAISDVVVTPFAQTYSGDEARTFAADASTPIEAGQVTTRVTVNARFELG